MKSIVAILFFAFVACADAGEIDCLAMDRFKGHVLTVKTITKGENAPYIGILKSNFLSPSRYFLTLELSNKSVVIIPCREIYLVEIKANENKK